MMRDKIDIDLSDEDDDFDNLSEIVDDEDKNMILDFMRLRPRTTKFLSENLEADEEDPTGFPLNIFEAPARFEVEYENCAEGAQNRSQCCGGDPDEFRDTGLDSTMSFSMKDDINSIRNISRRGYRAMSQNGDNNLFSSGNKKSQYQTAISQYNFQDLDGDQEEEDQEFNFKDIEMLMLAEKGDKLKINKQMSQRVSFAVSDSKDKDADFGTRKYSYQAQLQGQKLLTPCAFRANGPKADLAQFDADLDIDKDIDDKEVSPQIMEMDIKDTPTCFNDSLYQYYMSNKNNHWQQNWVDTQVQEEMGPGASMNFFGMIAPQQLHHASLG